MNMIQDVKSKITHGHHSCGNGFKQTKIFVPIDFSLVSYNSLQYALGLAKTFNGCIDLFHVIDIAEIAEETDNPVVMDRIVGRLEKKAAAKMESLKEMIVEEGVALASCELMLGNVKLSLQKRIEEIKPELIIVGKDSQTSPLIISLLKSLQYPILVVPKNVIPTLPILPALSFDLKPVVQHKLALLFEIVRETGQELTVINVQDKPSKKVESIERTLLGCNPETKINFVQYQNSHVVKGVEAFVKAMDVDFLCTIRRNRSFLHNLFKKSISIQLVKRMNIPVLVLAEVKR